jgi:hypothetical protein
MLISDRLSLKGGSLNNGICSQCGIFPNIFLKRMSDFRPGMAFLKNERDINPETSGEKLLDFICLIDTSVMEILYGMSSM